MPLLQLPRTAGCLVCGHENTIGLKLTSFVNSSTGIVSTTYTPAPEHIGFHGIVHGGIVSTVLDEIMVWAATWAGKRFCLAAELTVRFRSPARVGFPIQVEAQLAMTRSRLILTSGAMKDGDTLIATATGKYIPLDDADNAEFIATLVDDPATHAACELLRAGKR